MKTIITSAMIAIAVSAAAAERGDSISQSRLTLGGYGEINYSREFYSDNPSRYANPSNYKNDPSHGRTDVPHAVINLGYDFGRGWTFGTEIEFEHGGTGGAFERETDEGGEWEQEVEKGGEVELEQFWLQKSLGKALNLRAGHIVVPVGLLNSAHEPLNFFTVYRPEGEYTILPSTWHQNGVSLWGRCKDWKYELQLLAGLNALGFSHGNWIKEGVNSVTEFEVANKYAVAARIDNYTIKGMRIGVSGYYGHSIDNSFVRKQNSVASRLKGAVAIGSVDFTMNRWNWIVRGNFDYGFCGDADKINSLKQSEGSTSPYDSKTDVSKNALCYGAEAGYDIFSQLPRLSGKEKLYLFGRYEFYDSYRNALDTQKSHDWCRRSRMAFGLNYMPVKQIVVKAEYSKRFLDSKYNDEPSISLGIAYQGFFK